MRVRQLARRLTPVVFSTAARYPLNGFLPVEATPIGAGPAVDAAVRHVRRLRGNGSARLSHAARQMGTHRDASSPCQKSVEIVSRTELRTSISVALSGRHCRALFSRARRSRNSGGEHREYHLEVVEEGGHFPLLPHPLHFLLARPPLLPFPSRAVRLCVTLCGGLHAGRHARLLKQPLRDTRGRLQALLHQPASAPARRPGHRQLAPRDAGPANGGGGGEGGKQPR